MSGPWPKACRTRRPKVTSRGAGPSGADERTETPMARGGLSAPGSSRRSVRGKKRYEAGGAAPRLRWSTSRRAPHQARSRASRSTLRAVRRLLGSVLPPPTVSSRIRPMRRGPTGGRGGGTGSIWPSLDTRWRTRPSSIRSIRLPAPRQPPARAPECNEPRATTARVLEEFDACRRSHGESLAADGQ